MLSFIDGISLIAVILLVVAVTFVIKAVKVVPQQNAWVVERLGKFHAVLQPGLNIVIPFVDRLAYKHSLKEVPLDTPSAHETAIALASHRLVEKRATDFQKEAFRVEAPTWAGFAAQYFMSAAIPRTGTAAVMRVSMKPGAIAFTVMPRSASFSASART